MAKLFQCKNIRCAYVERVRPEISPDHVRYCPICKTRTMHYVSGDGALKHLKDANEKERLR